MYVSDQPVRTDYLPTTDNEVILKGDKLQEGMVVLLESVEDRGYDGEELEQMTPRERLIVLAGARWCTVTALDPEDDFTFIGLYADKTMRVRPHGAHVYWVVKRESIPKS